MSTLNATNLKNPSSGSNNIVLGTDGSTTIPTLSATTITGTSVRGGITSGTVNAGGTNPFNNTLVSVDFTGIPSWVKRVTVMFNGVSTNGTSNYLIQLGTSGGVVLSGYISTSNTVNQANGTGGSNSTSGFLLGNGLATQTVSGHMNITTLGSNVWVSSHLCKISTTNLQLGGGDVTLSGTLDRVRITTVNGSDTFDAGSINILYEG
jgi:hypothetical protein